MTSKGGWIIELVAVTFLLLTGCARVDYITDAQARIGVADWSKMKTVAVVMTEFSYAPADLRFKAGIPYKLQIQNQGSVKHYFTAERFFKAIATRKVQSNADGEIKAPYFLALEVFPGRSLDLYFVPVTKGTYRLHCTIAGHDAQGMHGSILIE